MTTQDLQHYPEETHHLESGYYGNLRSSTDGLHALGLQVIPSINEVVSRDVFTGLEEFEDWRRSGCSDIDDPEQFGLDGTQICGRWTADQSTYLGHFPVRISMNGRYRLVGWHNFFNSSKEDVYQQIDIAEEYSIPLGISVNTMTSKNILGLGGHASNSIIYAELDFLRVLAGNRDIRIETNGDYTWSYAHTNFQSEDIKEYFNRVSGRNFSLAGRTTIEGGIERNGLQPAYPSHVLGKQIQLISPGKDNKIIVISSASSAGVHFDVEDKDEDEWDEIGDNSTQKEGMDNNATEVNNKECTFGWDSESNEDENPEWIHSQDEDEILFQQAVNNYTASLKPKPPIKRPKPIDPSTNISHAMVESATADENLANAQNINLFDYLPQKLANALQLIMGPLPYDASTVLVSFLTGAASMLRLGTTVTGNELSNFIVPINLYTILVAKSGRKKTPLQKFFVREPASDMIQQVDNQNRRMMESWQEQCRGKKNNDRPPRPVAVDIRINDYTGEAFVQTLGKLDEVGRAVLVERDELAAVFASLNSYRSGKGSDEQQLLELYDGDGYRSLRVGDTGRTYSRAAVNIYGAIQPEVLEKLLKDGDANGMWARFSFIALPDMTRKLPVKSSPEQLMKLAAAKKYLKDFISTIYELPAIEYKLDEIAMELFSEYEYKKQKDAHATSVSAQAAMYGKSAGKVLRYAGLLHIIDCVGNDAMLEHSIPTSKLQNAIQLIDDQDSWTLDCHAKIAGISNKSIDRFERRVHELALTYNVPVGWTTIRNRMSSDEKESKTKGDAEKAISKFVALGLGEASKGPRGGLMYRALKPLPN